MLILVVVILLLVALVLGAGWIADSVAHARQAQATIEVAKVAQVQAVTNLMGFLGITLAILVLVIILVGLLLVIRSRSQMRPTSHWLPRSLPDVPRLPREVLEALPRARPARALPIVEERPELIEIEDAVEAWLADRWGKR